MRHLDYPDKIVRLPQVLYQISTSAVRVDDDYTELCRTLTGVRQGCIFSPQLFNILLELVISLAIQNLSIGINLSTTSGLLTISSWWLTLLKTFKHWLQMFILKAGSLVWQSTRRRQKSKWSPKKASLCPSTLMRKHWNKSRPSLT